MYNEWSLDVLYKGIDDPALQSDMATLETLITSYKEAVYALSADDPRTSLHRAVEITEKMTVTLRKLAGYFSLRRSTNSSDPDGAAYMTKIQGLIASTAKESAIFQKFAGTCPNLEEVIATDDFLKEYKFYFKELQQSASHRMGDEAEAVFARMNISGGRAWGDLTSYLTATVEVDWKGGKTNLSTIRGLAESSNAAERKAAYEAEIAC